MNDRAGVCQEAGEEYAREAGASPLLIGPIAPCAGIMVTNVSFTQPLLTLVTKDSRVSLSRVGFLPTVGQQADYAPRILLIVPLGDVLARRDLLWPAEIPSSAPTPCSASA